MEVAGLVVGIVPLIREVIKSYTTVRSFIKTYRRYSDETRRLFCQFDVQKTNFENECDLLLQGIEGQNDPENDSGEDAMLDSRLRERLSRNYESAVNTIEYIKSALEDIHGELQCFDILRSERLENESIKHTILRLRKKISIPFSKDRLENRIQALKDLNGDLSQIRSYVEKFLSKPSTLPGNSLLQERIPSHYPDIGQAARALHDALMASWRCNMANHADHKALLCLHAEPEANGSICLDMAISFQQTQIPPQLDMPFWLQIQSTVPSKSRHTPSVAQGALHNLSHLIQNKAPKNLEFSKKRSRDLDGDNSETWKPRRQMATTTTCRASSGQYMNKNHLDSSDGDDTSTLLDLAQRNDVCQILKEGTSAVDTNADYRHCLGYLKANEECKYLFYCPGSSRRLNHPVAQQLHARSMSVAEVISTVPYHEVRLDQQISVAHRLAVSLLQYNSTPWLEDTWRTEDVFILGDEPGLLERSLSTLHFKKNMPDRNAGGQAESEVDSPMEEIGNTAAAASGQVEDDMISLVHGVRNVPLFSLGVALLEISLQKPMDFQDGEDQILAVRKLARRPMRLGQRYEEVVRKCLECDFGHGNDLANAGLQRAVYGEVVCQLENLMSKLRLD